MPSGLAYTVTDFWRNKKTNNNTNSNIGKQRNDDNDYNNNNIIIINIPVYFWTTFVIKGR